MKLEPAQENEELLRYNTFIWKYYGRAMGKQVERWEFEVDDIVILRTQNLS